MLRTVREAWRTVWRDLAPLAELGELAERQEGAIARRQLLALGLTSDQARTHVRRGRWQVLWPGIYVIHTGPVSDLTRAYGAVLHCGDGAVAGGRTALWLAKAIPQFADPIEVCIPNHRHLQKVSGIRVHRVHGLAARSQTMTSPPRVRIEHAVLDMADRSESEEGVCDIVLRSLQQRLTTADRIRAALETRGRHRWRSLTKDVLADFSDGVHSPLELRYLRTVERPHGLPRALRNHQEKQADGRSKYHDVRYSGYQLVVELDGREAHPATDAFRDLRRDNAVVAGGEVVLRYGWRDVAGDPCAVASEVAGVLTARGWPGRPRRCGPNCRIG